LAATVAIIEQHVENVFIGVSANAANTIAAGTTTVNAVVGSVTKGVAGPGVSLGSGFAMNPKVLTTVDGMAAVAASGYDCGFVLWANPFGEWARRDTGTWEGSPTPGFRADTYGFNLGFHKVLDFGKIGVFGGFADTSVKDKTVNNMAAGGMHVDNWTFGIYGDFNVKNFLFSAAFGHSWSRYHNVRMSQPGAVVPIGKHNGNIWFSALKVGYDFKVASCWTITPTFGWNYTDVNRKAHHTYLKQSMYSSRLPMMVKFAYNFTGGNVFLQTGYTRELGGKAPDIRLINGVVIRSSDVLTRPTSNDFGTVGVGFDGNAGRFTYGAGYDYEFDTRGYNSHAVNLRFGIKF